MAPVVRKYLSKTDTSFHKELSQQDREELLKLGTLQELPKARYATKIAITAMRARSTRYSHVEVYKMVELIATKLRESGVRPRTVCAMSLENSVEAIVYFLALQWIGAVAAPVDTRLSLEHTVRVLRAVSAATLVSAWIHEDDQEEDLHFQKIKSASTELGIIHWHVYSSINEGVTLDMHGKRASEGAAWSGGAADFKIDSSEIAIRYASVDEDVSLVVPLTHGNVASAIRMFSGTYELSADDSTILTRPWFSIDGLLSILSTIYSGGHIVVPACVNAPDAEFLSLCAENNVDWFTEGPHFLAALYETAKKEPSKMDDVKLTFIRSVGGNMDEHVLDEMEDVLKAPILESYGTPETCGIVSSNIETEYRAGTKGTAPSKCCIKIFNTETLQELQVGETGAIGVAGSHVSTGYLDNEEVNKKVLVLAKGDDGTDMTYFLTGDEGSLDREGYLKVKATDDTGRATKFAQELRERRKREQAEMEMKEKEIADKLLEEQRELESASHEDQRNDGEEVSEAENSDTLRKSQKSLTNNDSASNAEDGSTNDARQSEEGNDGEDSGNFDDQMSAGKSSTAEKSITRGENLQDRAWIARERSASSTASSSKLIDRDASRSQISDKNEMSRSSSAVDASSNADSLQERTQENQGHDERSLATSEDISSTNDESSNAQRAVEVVKYVQQQPIIVNEVDPKLLNEILERLGAIEENQKRLEVEVEQAHRKEMDEMKELLREAMEMNEKPKPAPVVEVNMDQVNSAVTEAATAAIESRRNTDKAVKAANAAAEAAKRAAEKVKTPPALTMVTGPSSVVEVKDPTKIHKTVLVSLDEVEKAIEVHPAVAVARAFGRPDKKYGSEVFCVIVAKTGARVSEPWLKLHAQSVLPAAFVPKKFYVRDSLDVEHDREALAKDKTLKRVSHLAGYSSSRVIKSPTWSKPAAAEAS